jgi:hypothetical protein
MMDERNLQRREIASNFNISIYFAYVDSVYTEGCAHIKIPSNNCILLF